VHEGLVEKVARGTYTLTPHGEKFVGSFSTKTNRLSENIKTVVMLWVEHDGRPLLFRWSRQPYMGQATFPYDRMVIGKSLHKGIQDALKDKLGIEKAETEYVASALIRIAKNDMIISHMNALVYRVHTQDLEDGFQARNGQTLWMQSDTEGVMDGIDEFLEQLRAGRPIIESVWRY
jgi:hypothetical protein